MTKVVMVKQTKKDKSKAADLFFIFQKLTFELVDWGRELTFGNYVC